jgi:low temperature requirement protein LtrA
LRRFAKGVVVACLGVVISRLGVVVPINTLFDRTRDELLVARNHLLEPSAIFTVIHHAPHDFVTLTMHATARERDFAGGTAITWEFP